ncbi:YfcL family protein [Amphritea sp. 1_MG-2023]|uniref:YfcL family protein n=1 Tax=Amphritea sp. 1_MG-2023 TaxID=3062670 RepID=UPI0026E1204D|nr:YfcL family protein [Amphritea sp. 1_MG-2023]MDO6562265.1 YfcL family protein [Amphritea sp. 1_MG-2023]
MTPYAQQADTIYNQLLTLEQDAEPNQLFLCSYLLGHISLVGAAQGDTALQFNQQLEQSLEDAFKVDQLSEQDIDDIRALWQQLSETTT